MGRETDFRISGGVESLVAGEFGDSGAFLVAAHKARGIDAESQFESCWIFFREAHFASEIFEEQQVLFVAAQAGLR
jgi:hypothetical protein